ncbi:DNA-directed RNA polymerase subunit beta [Ureaplasma ceti]|uniref:DNA-directed RNA polymerase subunit beta n=1 Tax=Ureaplasma ceti TaxID=3119530 RepID=A0ABP9UA81_9BACT
MKKNNQFENHKYSSKVMRRDYSKIKTNFESPDLLATQRDSFARFLEEDLKSVVTSIFPIDSPQQKYQIRVNDIKLGEPHRTEEECRDESKTYDASLHVDLELVNNETGEVKKAKVTKDGVKGIFFGNIPLMTDKGTFVINGIEKFVIAQIIRSPGMYVLNKSQIKLNNSRKKVLQGNICELLPYKGTLMLINVPESKAADSDKVVQITARNASGESAAVFLTTSLLKAYGLTNNEIREIYSEEPNILATLENEKYNANDVLDFPDIINIRSELQEERHNGEVREFILNKGAPIERKLRRLLLEYIELEEENQQLKEEENTEQLTINNELISNLLDKIVTEKAAKDVANELGLNSKTLENQVSEANMCFQALVVIHLFNQRYYDLSSAGRYKFDRKLRLTERLYQRVLAEDLYDINGKKLLSKGDLLGKEQIDIIKAHSKAKTLKNFHELTIKNAFTDFEEISDAEKLQSSVLSYERILVRADNEKEDSVTSIVGLGAAERTNTLTISDIVASISYAYNLMSDIGDFDDIDHLGNKRLKLIHEQLKNRLQVGMLRIEKSIREKLAIADGNNNETTDEDGQKKMSITVKSVINTKPFQIILKDFFNSYQLIQFIDQQNPLSELTNKRRISAMGPGGISREDPNLDIRDVHYSHYGRICPIETPEGMNIGLIMSLASFSRVDENGFIMTPYRVVKNEVVTDEIKWLTPLQDDEYIIGESNVELDENNKILNERVIARYRGSSDLYEPKRLDFIDVLPKQVVSVAASSIPFLENDDANRALMGANMQRQAVPLVKPYAPWVGTGSEYKIAHDSGMAYVAKTSGTVTAVDGKQITVTDEDGNKQTRKLIKFRKSNQNTCINQTPIVELGQKIAKGDTLSNGPAMQNGELALGRNMLVGFTTWNGFNFEDAIILSKRLVQDDVYTSIHVDEYTLQCLVTKNGDEEITRDMPNVSDNAKRFLDQDGIIMVGAEVKEGDVLVGKITPRGQVDLSPEEKLLQAIFGDKTKNFKDSSLKVPHGGEGIVAAVKRFNNTDEENSDLGDDVIEVVKVYIVQKRKIQVGDKMAGRHGNKGIVSNIVPVEDMPFLEDGTPLDVLLNPLGVPSRMNIGQILEIHLGLSARELGKKELLRIAFEKLGHEELVARYGLRECVAEKLYARILKLVAEADVKTYEALIEKVNTFDLIIALNDLGLTFADIGYKVATPVFEGVNHGNLEDIMREAGIDPIQTKGKFKLRDGKTGEYFDGDISVGVMYMLKLDHMVDDKIHARSVGPYSKITQQPLGGKSQNGGQRFGEMEVWALEAYGAAHNLHEILTIKSDDVRGRNLTYSSIIKGNEIPSGGTPESFKLLTKQLQGLGLYLEVIDSDDKETDINDYISHESEDDKKFEEISHETEMEIISSTRPSDDDDDDDDIDEEI